LFFFFGFYLFIGNISDIFFSHEELRGDHGGLFKAIGPTPPSMKPSATKEILGDTAVLASKDQIVTATVLTEEEAMLEIRYKGLMAGTHFFPL
jgi:hypothetical protein